MSHRSGAHDPTPSAAPRPPRAYSPAAPEPARGHGAARPGDSGAVEVTYRDPRTDAIWTVTECDARTTPGAQGARCLVFWSELAVRRIWAYPHDWQALELSALIALSWRR